MTVLENAWTERERMRKEADELFGKARQIYREACAYVGEERIFSSANVYIMFSEGDILFSRGSILYAEGDRIYCAAVIAAYGPLAVIDWKTGKVLEKC